MTVTDSISAAMDAVASKKERLHKAYLELQSHSSALVNFTVQWKELEDHFNDLEKLMQKRFEELGEKGKENVKEKKLAAEKSNGNPKEKKSAAENSTGNPKEASPASKDDVKPRPELKSLCEKMDSEGLKIFLVANRKDVRDEVHAALKFAPDPAKLVLQSLEDFYPPEFIGNLQPKRRACDLLLESLALVTSPDELSSEAKKDAQKIAAAWRPKLNLGTPSRNGGHSLEAHAFLQLLASYGISKKFKDDDLSELVLHVVHRRHAADLCRALHIGHKIPDVVEKMISRGMQLEAVEFVYAFGLVEKFPPVPLLKASVNDAKKATEEVLMRNGVGARAQNSASSKEIALLKSVMKSIGDHKLESQMSSENLQKRVAQLEEGIEERRRSADASKANADKEISADASKANADKGRSADASKANADKKKSADASKANTDKKRSADASKANTDKTRSADASKSQNKRLRVNSGVGVGVGVGVGAGSGVGVGAGVGGTGAFLSTPPPRSVGVGAAFGTGAGAGALLPTPAPRSVGAGAGVGTGAGAGAGAFLSTPLPRSVGVGVGVGAGAGAGAVAGAGALFHTPAPRSAFALSNSSDLYQSTPPASIPSYNLPSQGVYDRPSQGIYRSPYGIESNPSSLSRPHLYPSDSVQSSLYGGGSFGGSTNYGSYNIGSGVPSSTPYQSSYLR